MKDYHNMTLGNRKRYAISKLKKAINNQNATQDHVDLINSVIQDKCSNCRYDDFGRCILYSSMYDFNYTDEQINLECCKRALKILEGVD